MYKDQKDNLIISFELIARVVLGIIGTVVTILFFVKGLTFINESIYSLWPIPGGVTLFIILPVSLLLTIFKKTRIAASLGLLLCAYTLSLGLWLGCFVASVVMGGITALIAGVLMAGIGVVPVSSVLAMFHGEWGFVGMNVATITGIGVIRVLALFVADKGTEETSRSYPTAVEPSTYGSEGLL